MNKSQLIEELSKRVGNDKEEIRYILEELNNIIIEKTKAGEKYACKVLAFTHPAYRQAGWLEIRRVGKVSC